MVVWFDSTATHTGRLLCRAVLCRRPTPNMTIVKMGAWTNWSMTNLIAVVVDRGSGVGGNAPSSAT